MTVYVTVHYQFRYFQNGEPDRDELVGGYSLFCGANHDQIVIDNFTLSKCDLADGLCQFVWVANQTNVDAVANLLHRFAESCVGL